MVIAIAYFQKKVNEVDSTMKVSEEPIWFNPNLNIPYIMKWDNKRLKKIGDLFNDLGRIKSREQLMSDFNMTINFIDFTRITRAIPQSYLPRIIETGEKEMAPGVSNLYLSYLVTTKIIKTSKEL